MNRTILVAAICATFGSAAFAQTNLEKLGAFKVTGTKKHTVIDQTAPAADAIRETL